MGKAYNLLSKQHSCALFYPVIIFTYAGMAKPFKRHGYPPCLLNGFFSSKDGTQSVADLDLWREKDIWIKDT